MHWFYYWLYMEVAGVVLMTVAVAVESGVVDYAVDDVVGQP